MKSWKGFTTRCIVFLSFGLLLKYLQSSLKSGKLKMARLLLATMMKLSRMRLTLFSDFSLEGRVF